MMKPTAHAAAALLGVALTVGCSEPWPEPEAVDAVAFARDHEEWRTERRERSVTPPGGHVLWMGLWELTEGDTPFGSDPALPIVLPAEDAPPKAGILRRSGQSVELIPEPYAEIRVHDGEEVADEVVREPRLLGNDRSEEPTRLLLGSLGLRVHAEPGTDRLWLRAWDEDSPLRESFELPEYFAVDPGWRVRARYEPFDEAIMLRVPDVTGGTVEYRMPGELVFRRDGREHRLMASAGETSRSFFVMMWDSTGVDRTYQGGRYLRVELPDSTGWTTIDFNRAYNPPCVFTPYSVCALPPLSNRLKLPVTAGETRPDTYPDGRPTS